MRSAAGASSRALRPGSKKAYKARLLRRFLRADALSIRRKRLRRMADSVFPAQVPRYDETFPELTAQEIDRLRRYGSLRKYSDGEKLIEAGKISPGMFVVLKGQVAISQRDGLGHVAPIAEQGPGQFLADVGQLSTRAALVDGTAEGDVETLLIPTEGLRALLVGEAELGERIMRALILRRVALLKGGAAGAF